MKIKVSQKLLMKMGQLHGDVDGKGSVIGCILSEIEDHLKKELLETKYVDDVVFVIDVSVTGEISEERK